MIVSAALLLGSFAVAQTATPAQPAAPAATAPAAPAADPSTVVAQVGSETITLGDFETQFKAYVSRAVASQGVPYSDEILASFAPYRGEILNQIARQRAVLQLAQKSGVKPDATEVDARVQSSKEGFDNDADFQSALQNAGFADEAAYRAALNESLTYNAYLDSLKGRFKFGDAIVAGYYTINKSKLATQAEACAKHILVADEATAKKIADQLAAGGDFAALAKQYSQDPGSKDQGGDLGCIAPGDTVAEFDKAAFTGPLNQVQQVKTEYGYHLIVVTKRTAGGVPALADAATGIRDTLAADAAQKYLDAQIGKLGARVYADRVGAPTATAGK